MFADVLLWRFCDPTCGFRTGPAENPEKPKPKVWRHRTSDEADLQESAFFKKILAYQRKLLVRHVPVEQNLTRSV